MLLISHRGNIDGKNPNRENHPDYIEEALNLSFDVEVDVWYIDETLWLGHDEPQYEVSFQWLFDRAHQLWIHCKNHDALIYFSDLETSNRADFNYFWHQTDDVTLTSHNFMWVYPGKQPFENSIAVMPEINDDDILQCVGICSDYIKEYRIR